MAICRTIGTNAKPSGEPQTWGSPSKSTKTYKSGCVMAGSALGDRIKRKSPGPTRSKPSARALNKSTDAVCAEPILIPTATNAAASNTSEAAIDLDGNKMEMNMELPRQRETVVVSMTGDLRDVEHYMAILRRAAESSGDDTQRMGNQFKIYPRANND